MMVAKAESQPCDRDVRMTRLFLSMLFACAALAPAFGQSIGEPIPGRGKAASKAAPWKSESAAARPCPQYGPGFVKVEGSSLCVRAGGSVRVDVGRSSRYGTGSAVRGMAELETRGETSFGSVRTVVRAGGQIERNLDAGRYRY